MVSSPTDTNPVIEVDQLWQEFRPRSAGGHRRRGKVLWALQDVSIDVGSGGVLGVVGQNGSGKTTLLKSLAGVIAPSRGRLVTRGRVASLIDLSAGVNRDLTGTENIMLGGVLLGMTRSEVRSKYEEIAAFSGLTNSVLSQPLSAYSTGMGLRIAFSVVACSEPSILLVDEVLSVGDESFQRSCLDRLDSLRRSGCAIVIASHDLDLIVDWTDRAIVLDHGRLVDSGDPKSTVGRYAAALRSRTDASQEGF